MLGRLVLFGGVTIAVVLSACAAPSVDRPSDATPARDGPPSFVGKIWISTDSSAPRGTLRIFLPDGTLVIDSCGESYRLARWRALNERRIEWQEDTARIEAEVVRATEDDLQLRLHLVNELKDERYRLAEVPYVCPDTGRG